MKKLFLRSEIIASIILTSFAMSSLLFSTSQVTFATAGDFTVTGGNPASLPIVWDPSVLLPMVTITDPTGGDDFGADVTFAVYLANEGFYTERFDTTILAGAVTIGGTCGYDANPTVLTYGGNGPGVATLTLHDGGASNGCNANGDTITISNLRFRTNYAKTATVTPFIGVQAPTASVNSSNTVNLSITAPNAAASVVFSNPVVGTTTNSTTITLTIPHEAADNGQITSLKMTMPAYVDISALTMGGGVPGAVTGTFKGSSNFGCGRSGVAQELWCYSSTAGLLVGVPATIIIPGIKFYQVGSANISDLDVTYNGWAGSSIAVDTGVDAVLLTDATAADPLASITFAPATVGSTGTTTFGLTLPIALDAEDTVQISFPAYIETSGVAYSSNTFGGATFTCTGPAFTVICSANGAVPAGAGSIVVTGIARLYTGTSAGQPLYVFNEGDSGGQIAATNTAPMNDVTAADAAASVVLANPSVGGVGNTTVTFTLPIALANTNTVVMTFPAHMNVASAAFSSKTDFGGAGTFFRLFGIGTSRYLYRGWSDLGNW